MRSIHTAYRANPRSQRSGPRCSFRSSTRHWNTTEEGPVRVDRETSLVPADDHVASAVLDDCVRDRGLHGSVRRITSAAPALVHHGELVTDHQSLRSVELGTHHEQARLVFACAFTACAACTPRWRSRFVPADLVHHRAAWRHVAARFKAAERPTRAENWARLRRRASGRSRTRRSAGVANERVIVRGAIQNRAAGVRFRSGAGRA